MLAHQRLDLHLVELAAGQHDRRPGHAPGVFAGGHERDKHVFDVGFDVDAGLVLELVLAILFHREGRADLLAKVGGHDVADVGVGNQGGVGRNELQFGWTALLG